MRIISRDIQCRKWLLTINNPDEHNFSEGEIENILNTFKFRYACLSREIGENGTPHIHLFIYAKSRIRFSTIKKRFPTAHIDKAYGSVVDNIAYITKTENGKTQTKPKQALKEVLKNTEKLPQLLKNIPLNYLKSLMILFRVCQQVKL